MHTDFACAWPVLVGDDTRMFDPRELAYGLYGRCVWSSLADFFLKSVVNVSTTAFTPVAMLPPDPLLPLVLCACGCLVAVVVDDEDDGGGDGDDDDDGDDDVPFIRCRSRDDGCRRGWCR